MKHLQEIVKRHYDRAAQVERFVTSKTLQLSLVQIEGKIANAYSSGIGDNSYMDDCKLIVQVKHKVPLAAIRIMDDRYKDIMFTPTKDGYVFRI